MGAVAAGPAPPLLPGQPDGTGKVADKDAAELTRLNAGYQFKNAAGASWKGQVVRGIR
ncbi:hypothetical protein AB0C81_14460 [Streptomyces roseoverticillatus]|uniref:hypothetical protein n=1 Tax=Streptomyces roseoverticillatus TaxID=66429 RepID=UPI0033DBE4BA